MAKSDSKGRGWHGDPEGHAKAGRKGGQASSVSQREGRRSSSELVMDEDQSYMDDEDIS